MRIRALNEEAGQAAAGGDGAARAGITREAQEADLVDRYTHALELQRQGAVDEANTEYGAVIAELDEHARAGERPVDSAARLRYSSLRNLGLNMEQGSRKQAVERLLAAAEIDATDVMLWYNIGRIAAEAEDHMVARTAFEQALHLRPRHWMSLDRLLGVHLALGNGEAAHAVAACLLEVDPVHAIARKYLDPEARAKVAPKKSSSKRRRISKTEKVALPALTVEALAQSLATVHGGLSRRAGLSRMLIFSLPTPEQGGAGPAEPAPAALPPPDDDAMDTAPVTPVASPLGSDPGDDDVAPQTASVEGKGKGRKATTKRRSTRRQEKGGSRVSLRPALLALLPEELRDEIHAIEPLLPSTVTPAGTPIKRHGRPRGQDTAALSVFLDTLAANSGVTCVIADFVRWYAHAVPSGLGVAKAEADALMGVYRIAYPGLFGAHSGCSFRAVQHDPQLAGALLTFAEVCMARGIGDDAEQIRRDLELAEPFLKAQPASHQRYLWAMAELYWQLSQKAGSRVADMKQCETWLQALEDSSPRFGPPGSGQLEAAWVTHRRRALQQQLDFEQAREAAKEGRHAEVVKHLTPLLKTSSHSQLSESHTELLGLLQAAYGEIGRHEERLLCLRVLLNQDYRGASPSHLLEAVQHAITGLAAQPLSEAHRQHLLLVAADVVSILCRIDAGKRSSRREFVSFVVEAWLAFHSLMGAVWETTSTPLGAHLETAFWSQAHMVLGSYGMCCAADGKLLRRAVARLSALASTPTAPGWDLVPEGAWALEISRALYCMYGFRLTKVLLCSTGGCEEREANCGKIHAHSTGKVSSKQKLHDVVTACVALGLETDRHFVKFLEDLVDSGAIELPEDSPAYTGLLEYLEGRRHTPPSVPCTALKLPCQLEKFVFYRVAKIDISYNKRGRLRDTDDSMTDNLCELLIADLSYNPTRFESWRHLAHLFSRRLSSEFDLAPASQDRLETVRHLRECLIFSWRAFEQALVLAPENRLLDLYKYCGNLFYVAGKRFAYFEVPAELAPAERVPDARPLLEFSPEEGTSPGLDAAVRLLQRQLSFQFQNARSLWRAVEGPLEGHMDPLATPEMVAPMPFSRDIALAEAERCVDRYLELSQGNPAHKNPWGLVMSGKLAEAKGQSARHILGLYQRAIGKFEVQTGDPEYWECYYRPRAYIVKQLLKGSEDYEMFAEALQLPCPASKAMVVEALLTQLKPRQSELAVFDFHKFVYRMAQLQFHILDDPDAAVATLDPCFHLKPKQPLFKVYRNGKDKWMLLMDRPGSFVEHLAGLCALYTAALEAQCLRAMVRPAWEPHTKLKDLGAKLSSSNFKRVMLGKAPRLAARTEANAARHRALTHFRDGMGRLSAEDKKRVATELRTLRAFEPGKRSAGGSMVAASSAHSAGTAAGAAAAQQGPVAAMDTA